MHTANSAKLRPPSRATADEDSKAPCAPSNRHSQQPFSTSRDSQRLGEASWTSAAGPQHSFIHLCLFAFALSNCLLPSCRDVPSAHPGQPPPALRRLSFPAPVAAAARARCHGGRAARIAPFLSWSRSLSQPVCTPSAPARSRRRRPEIDPEARLAALHLMAVASRQPLQQLTPPNSSHGGRGSWDFAVPLNSAVSTFSIPKLRSAVT